MPVMRSTLRMLFPSARAVMTLTCFSIGRLLAMAFVLDFLCHTNYGASILFVAQKRKTHETPRIGRPKLPDGSARSEMVRARFTPEEHEKNERAADESGESVSEWVRKVLLASL